jgi:hypothetical protein
MYSEFCDDPKVQMMSEAMQRRLIMLLCERCKEETLHETERAFHWRISETDLTQTRVLFIEKGFIDENWNLLNWNRRQFLSDSSTDRVRKHRRGMKQDETLHVTNGTKLDVTVTPPEQNRTEADSEAEQNRTDTNAPASAELHPEQHGEPQDLSVCVLGDVPNVVSEDVPEGFGEGLDKPEEPKSILGSDVNQDLAKSAPSSSLSDNPPHLPAVNGIEDLSKDPVEAGWQILALLANPPYVLSGFPVAGVFINPPSKGLVGIEEVSAEALTSGVALLATPGQKQGATPPPTPQQEHLEAPTTGKLPEKEPSTVSLAISSDGEELIRLAYPLKVGLEKARKAIRNQHALLVKGGRLTADGDKLPKMTSAAATAYLYERTQAYASSPKGSSGQFIPHPSTWFNAGSYTENEVNWNGDTNGTTTRSSANNRVEAFLSEQHEGDSVDGSSGAVTPIPNSDEVRAMRLRAQAHADRPRFGTAHPRPF